MKLGDKIERDVEKHETAQAITKRDEQFAQQITVKQTHSPSSVMVARSQSKPGEKGQLGATL
jgi:hypothetical protein